MIIEIFIFIFLILTAVTLHEFGHGWAAYKLGDPTAKNLGRLTLNPIAHVDPIGTVILPGVLIFMNFSGINAPLFGWAKPVPVNFMNLGNPKRDMMWVGIAGPIANFILVALFTVMVKQGILVQYHELWVNGIFLNLLLAYFNLIPIPPLDGSRILMGILPRDLAIPYSRLERYGILIVFAIVAVGGFRHVVLPMILHTMNFLGVM